jgi:lipopolysaccharide transport system permease protein
VSLIADLLFMITWRDIKIKYKQSVMGLLWAVLMPGIIVAAGMLVQLGMSQLSGRPFTMDKLAAICVKSLPWAFIVSGIRFATNSLTSNANLLTKINCPRIVFPISAVLSALFDMLVAALPLIVLLVFLGVRPAPSQLWVIPLLLLMVLFVAGLGIAFSAANLYFRDVKYIVEVVLTFAIFFTPVFYSSDLLGPWREWLLLNPVAPLLEGLEQSVVQGRTPDLVWRGCLRRDVCSGMGPVSPARADVCGQRVGVMRGPHARFVRCPPGGRSVPFGRPGGR